MWIRTKEMGYGREKEKETWLGGKPVVWTAMHASNNVKRMDWRWWWSFSDNSPWIYYTWLLLEESLNCECQPSKVSSLDLIVSPKGPNWRFKLLFLLAPYLPLYLLLHFGPILFIYFCSIIDIPFNLCIEKFIVIKYWGKDKIVLEWTPNVAKKLNSLTHKVLLMNSKVQVKSL